MVIERAHSITSEINYDEKEKTNKREKERMDRFAFQCIMYKRLILDDLTR